MKGKTHDLNNDLTFSANTINCVCHSIRSMFRVLGMYNFGSGINYEIGFISKNMRSVTHCLYGESTHTH